ncbi:MAG: nucleotidyltransferase family protein [Elusimicrobiales bacterium]|nr:nucleotidyltransferase family protein [Elusimicrobiales bacterium]
MKGFILCAGLGTRLRPLTDTVPKPLIDIDGENVLEKIIIKLKNNGITEIAVNLHHLSDKIIGFLKSKNFGVKFHFSYEKEILDTGGGIKKIKDFVSNENLIVHNGDILTDFDLNSAINFHEKYRNDVTLCVMEREGSRKLAFDGEMNLSGWVNIEKNIHDGEVKDKIMYSFMGVHIISPSVFGFMPKEDKFPIFDFYIRNLKNIKIKGYPVKPDYWFDIGTYEKLEKAKNFFREFNKGRKL